MILGSYLNLECIRVKHPSSKISRQRISRIMASGCSCLEQEARHFGCSSLLDGSEGFQEKHRNEPKELKQNGKGDDVVSMNVSARFTQIGMNNRIIICSKSDSPYFAPGIERHKTTGPFLREHSKPEGCVAIGRSRLGFPDPKKDHLVELTVCKGPDTRETVDITDKYDVVVRVEYDGTTENRQGTAPEYQCKRDKRGKKDGTSGYICGLVAFLFRFHEPNVKYKITFALKSILPTKRRKKKNESCYVNNESLSKVSVTLETGSAESKLGKSRMKTQKNQLVERRKAVAPLCVLGPASQSEECTDLVKRSYWVMKELQSLRDNAKWEDFNARSFELVHKFSDVDTRIAIKLEESVAACYRNDLERSIQLIDESDRMIPQAKNSLLLGGRSKCYLAGVLRRQRKLGEAEHCVELAQQNLHGCQANVDISYVLYEKASVLLDFIARAPQRSLTQVREALNNFEKCVDVCVRMEAEDCELYLKKHHFAFIKMALLLLDCRTEAARNRILSREFIAKGRECLDMLETKYLSEISEGVKVQFYLARSDLEYREWNFLEAEKFARKAREMATSLGFDTEIGPAQERLNHVIQVQEQLTHNEGDTNMDIIAPPPVSSAGSEGACGDVSASGSESDWWRF